MPNTGPSSVQTANTSAGLIPSQSSSILAGGALVTQSGVAVGTPAVSLLVAQTGLPVGIAPTGTMGANGAVTLGTALQNAAIYSAGVYFYYPAGAVYSGSLANFYLTKMSSTTVGTVFNNTYVAANGLPSIPSALVPVVDAGPGAYTGVTTVQTALQVTVPGNILGNSGSLQHESLCSYPNSAGVKTVSGTWGGIVLLNLAPTTTASAYYLRNVLNRGAPGSQISVPSGTGAVMGANAATVGLGGSPVDTTQPSTITITLTLAAATDYLILEFFRATAFYSA